MKDNNTLHPSLKTTIKLYCSACLLCIAFFGSSPAYALTRVWVSNYQRLDIKIARNDLTHIVVKQDRIQQVRGLKGRYFLDRDDQTGSIYLLPMPAYQKKAFSIFIITEKGKTYALRCIPTDQPADTLLLTKQVTSISARSHIPSSSKLNRRLHTMKRRYVYAHRIKRKRSHHHKQHITKKRLAHRSHRIDHGMTETIKRQTLTPPDFSKPSRINELTHLLKAMMKHQVIKGYEYRHRFIVHHQYLADKALKVWIPFEYLPKHGRKYQGQFLIVKNNTQHNVVLTHDLFRTDHTEMIAIKTPLLAPQAQTRVYRVERITPNSTQ